MKKALGDWSIKIILSIVVVFILLVVVNYFRIFNGSFSEEHSEWGEFGNLFGAIAGLLAFAGAIATLRQNSRQMLKSEERTTFFQMLDVFLNSTSKIVAKPSEDLAHYKSKSLSVNETFDSNKEYSRTELFDFISQWSLSLFQQNIQDSIPEYFQEDEVCNILELDKEFSKPIDKKIQNNIYSIMKALYENHNRKGFTQSSDYLGKSLTVIAKTHVEISNNLIAKVLSHYVESGDLKPISDAAKKVGDRIYRDYGNPLGVYYRNAYYLLDLSVSFSYFKESYKTFRAQLSKCDLIILFFNSFSSQSTPRTRKLYLEADLFNNLTWRDVGLSELTKDVESKIDYHSLCRLYNSIV